MGQDPGCRRTTPPVALIVAGPTCSGKSLLAMHLARHCDGVVINADSMQVYQELRVLTARPTPAEEASVPHRLYGVRPASAPGSAAWWRTAALAAMACARAAGKLPILCGGTGLYFHALLHGLADVPDPGGQARAEARALLDADGAAALHARLAAVDPVTAARLRPSDGQRLARAWEVWRGTGRPLSEWLATPPPPSGWQFQAVLLDPPRPALRDAIAARFQAMLASDAIAEVQALLALGLDTALPAMRAHGVPELAGYLRGAYGIDHAVQQATLATVRYTKRQATWFRHHRVADTHLTHMIYARYADRTQFPERIPALQDIFGQTPG